MHVPLLVKYHQLAHTVAGMLVGVVCLLVFGIGWLALVVSVPVALALGTVKEYRVDEHPRNKEIGPWGIGAGIACLVPIVVALFL
jgi:hypothetical protein